MSSISSQNNTAARTPIHVLMRYGALGVPLAFVGLPVYVHVPKFYAETMQLGLAQLGVILLIIRLLDTISDPVIGAISDCFRAYRRGIMAACVPLLAFSYYLLFAPPAFAHEHSSLWLSICLSMVYLMFSTLMINYYAMGIDMAHGYHDNTRISAWREGSMLVGVLLASMLPSILMHWFALAEAYRWFGVLLAPLLVLGSFSALSVMPQLKNAAVTSMKQSFADLLSSREVRWVLTIALFNAIPTAITSTLFLFFTGDILHAGNQSGPMLAVYFLSAAAGMPLWTTASARVGKRRSLLLAMVTAVICFVWAWGLGSGDIFPFYIICVLSGMTLGADSALLPSLFADALATRSASSATGFGLWNLTSKLTMALAAGIALPLLAYWGYRSGEANTAAALGKLSLCYALLPCLFKVLAIILLYISPLDKRGTHAGI